MTDDIDYSIHYRRWHKETQAHFDEVARHLDNWLGPSIAHLAKDSRVLDYGCGFGLLTSFLAQRFAEVVGVDASEQQIAVGLTRGLPVRHVAIADFPGWAEAQRNSFDVVFLFDVLEHLPPPEQIKFLRRLVSTLRVGGTIFVKVPNASSPLAARWRYIDWTHLSSFTECSLEFVCHHAGLADFVSLPDDSSGPARWPWLLRWRRRRYYVKSVGRWLWRQYLRSEIGDEADKVPLGLNMMIKATRVS